jgi:hypothetical protein
MLSRLLMEVKISLPPFYLLTRSASIVIIEEYINARMAKTSDKLAIRMEEQKPG